MDLDSLRAEEAVENEEEEKDDELEFPIETDVEVDLSDALSLLGDCCTLLETLTDERVCKVTGYMRQEIVRIAEESRAFLFQWEIPDKELDKVRGG